MMRIVLLLTLVLSGAARAQDVVVRTSLDPSGPVVLGQSVALDVDVLFPGEMVHPPRVARPRVEGAQVFSFQTQGMTIRDRVGEANYIGQRFEFDVYPRRAGTLSVPSVEVMLLDRAGAAVGTAHGPALTIEARAPPGLDPAGPIVAATAVTMQETWEPAHLAALHPGDALVRRITRTAEGVPGLAMAALSFDAPAGVRAYADPPQINDRVERGVVTGTRIDRVTYVFEQGGQFLLPAVSQPWWNLKSRTARTLTAPARTVDVLAAPIPSGAPRAWAWLVALALAALAILAGIAAWFWHRPNSPAHAERTAFRTLRRQCRHGDPAAVYRAWRVWDAARVTRGDRADAALLASVRHLEACVFGGDHWSAGDARVLAHTASRARKPVRVRAPAAALPPLNATP